MVALWVASVLWLPALLSSRGRRRGVALELTRGTEPVRLALPAPGSRRAG